MLDSINQWCYWADFFPKYINEQNKIIIIPLDILTEKIKVNPDGYGGTDRKYYFCRTNAEFHTALSDWDGGNFWSNRSYQDEVLPLNRIIDVLEEQKRCTLEKNNTHSKELEEAFLTIRNSLITLAGKTDEDLSK